MVAAKFAIGLLSQIVHGFEPCTFSIMNYEYLLQYRNLWFV
jgi:hypothetical protein